MASTITDNDKLRLIKAAFEAKEGSYSPYSKFRVGAALLCRDGQIYKGSNVENASYGASICAERTVLVKAVSEGSKHFDGLAVVTDVPSCLSPCGICRQFIREFCSLDMPVVLVPSDYFDSDPGSTKDLNRTKIMTVGELLPESFGPEHLGMQRLNQ